MARPLKASTDAYRGVMLFRRILMLEPKATEGGETGNFLIPLVALLEAAPVGVVPKAWTFGYRMSLGVTTI